MAETSGLSAVLVLGALAVGGLGGLILIAATGQILLGILFIVGLPVAALVYASKRSR